MIDIEDIMNAHDRQFGKRGIRFKTQFRKVIYFHVLCGTSATAINRRHIGESFILSFL
jgi:hypothetical protein